MARLALFHDTNTGGDTGLVVTRDNYDAPWEAAVTDYGKLIFDSRNPNQIEPFDMFVSEYGDGITFSSASVSQSVYQPAGTGDGDCESMGIAFSNTNVELTRLYEATYNTLGLDYPNIAVRRRLDDDGWVMGNFTINRYRTSGSIVTGYYFSATSIYYGGDKAIGAPSGSTYAYYLSGAYFDRIDHTIFDREEEIENTNDDIVLHLNLPSDNTAIPIVEDTPAPGQVIARLANTGVKVARPGFDVDSASPEQLLIDSDRAPLRIVKAGEVAIAAGATELIDLPGGIDVGPTALIDYIAWASSDPAVLYPTYYQGTVYSDFDTRRRRIRSRIVDNQLQINNQGFEGLNVRYILFGTDDNAPTSGSSKLVGIYNDGIEDYVQMRRPGAGDPPTLRDVLLDTRFPYCPIIAEGFWAVPNSAGAQTHAVTFTNDGSFKPFPIFCSNIRRNFDASIRYASPFVKKLVNVNEAGGIPGAGNGLISGDSCYAVIEDDQITFVAYPQNPDNISYGGGSYTYHTDHRIVGVRYYILALPVDFNPVLDLVAGAGAFTLTGKSAGLGTDGVLVTETGEFALTGQDATLTYDEGGYSCTMTAATIPGAGATGYSEGSLFGAAGSIDQEPVPGETVTVIGSDPSATIIYFLGDLTSILNGLSVWVDGTDYTSLFGTTWTHTSGVTYIGTTDGGRPTFTASTSYLIEIK